MTSTIPHPKILVMWRLAWLDAHCERVSLPEHAFLIAGDTQIGLLNAGTLSTAANAKAFCDWDIHSGDRHEWLRKDLQVVLVHPVIPQNVGNIARTCAATGVGLHLVEPLGFELDDRKLKRAGLDYWPFVAVRTHASWQDFREYFASLPEPKRLHGYSKFAQWHYATDGLYEPGDWLVFGAETSGLPFEAHQYVPSTGGRMLKIPMRDAHVRSLNLAVSVGIGTYEAIRQLDGAAL